MAVMESPLATWETGTTFSDSSELSPPISPSPLSPTLYSNAHQEELVPSCVTFSKPECDSSSISYRAQLASKLLRDLESESFSHQYGNQIGMEWSEEQSIDLDNLELFEDIDNLDFSTRPLTPVSQEFKLQTINESPPASPSTEFSSDSFTALSEEFQNILAGLATHITTVDNGEVIEIFNLPSPPGEETDSSGIEMLANEASQDENGGGNEDKDSQGSAENIMEFENENDDDDESNMFEDFELQLIGLNEESQSQSDLIFSEAGSPSSSVSQEASETSDDTCESVLDALLLGDLETAKSLLPPTPTMEVVVLPRSSRVTRCTSNKKPKRSLASTVVPPKTIQRSGMKKPRLPSNTDKVQRKKEQNKTAATRYREKKKLEAAIVSEKEEALEKINTELKAQQEDLRRQVLIYKELLRAVMTDRKGKTKASSVGNRSKRLR